MSQRPQVSVIAADRAALKAIQELVDYQSVNPACSTVALAQVEATLRAAEEATERARRAYEQARAVEADTARMFHSGVMAAKAQVLAQYGSDSYAVQAIGLTRKSDRKRPVRRPSAG